MRKVTKHVEQLKRMYSIEDGRYEAEGRWKKLPFFWFLLFLSYRCTRRCSYCYSFNQVGDNENAEMDDNTFSKLLEWIPEVWRANNVKVNAVGFLGGEPLLRTDRIKKVMDRVFNSTDGMQGYVYTNGDLIDSVDWNDLEEIQWITTNITDIGIDELARRMRIIGDRSNAIGQTIVATLDDHNLERALDIARFGIENGYRLRFYRNLFKGLDQEYQNRLLNKYRELCDLFENYIDRGYDVHTTYLFDTLIPLWDGDSSPYHCGKRIAAVFPDGTIGPCLRNHTFKTGTIFDPDPMSKIRCDTFHYGADRADLPQECKECESCNVCQGGCPNDRLLLTGTASGKSLVCHIHKEIIPRLRDLEKRKDQNRSNT